MWLVFFFLVLDFGIPFSLISIFCCFHSKLWICCCFSLSKHEFFSVPFQNAFPEKFTNFIISHSSPFSQSLKKPKTKQILAVIMINNTWNDQVFDLFFSLFRIIFCLFHVQFALFFWINYEFLSTYDTTTMHISWMQTQF